jgi:RNA polymerase sigma-70 factor (ECF subfamily)
LATPESQLLERARAYDAEALAEIYDCYSGAIYRYLYRHVGDAAQAEDLTSEVFLRLLQALNTRKAPRKHLQGWLYRVAHNLAMDLFRKRPKAETLVLDESLATTAELPPALVQKHQDQVRLRVAVRQLSPDQQQVILLRFGEGLKIREVGQVLGKSEGAVKVLQHRAVNRLRKLLASEEV